MSTPRHAPDTLVGQKLGLTTTTRAAEAILTVANARMAGPIRLVSIERQFDPKRFAFMPFGGGGALHTGAMLREVGIGSAIVPRYPGVTSAMGCVIADMRQDVVQTINSLTATLDLGALRDVMQRHVSDGLALLQAARSRFASHDMLFELDMAYVGLTHRAPVPLSVTNAYGAVAAPSLAGIVAAFDAACGATYGRLLPDAARRMVNLRTAVIGRRPKFDLATLAPGGGSLDAARRGSRAVHFGEAWHETAICDRPALPVGAEIVGPAFLVQPDTTVLIEPGLVGRVDAFGNTIITATEATGGRA